MVSALLSRFSMYTITSWQLLLLCPVRSLRAGQYKCLNAYNFTFISGVRKPVWLAGQGCRKEGPEVLLFIGIETCPREAMKWRSGLHSPRDEVMEL